jgi:AAHS family benzoate transporter-like MFS transporter
MQPHRSAMSSPPRILLLGFLILFVDGYDMYSLGTVGPSLLAYDEWNVTPTTLGLLAAATGVGMPLGATIGGWVSDRVGRRTPIIAALSLISAAMVLATFAPNLPVFAFARFLTGIAIAALAPLVVAMVSDHAPKQSRTLYISAALSAFGVGGAAAALVGWAVLPETHFQWVFVAGALPFLFLVPLWRLLPAQRPSSHDGATADVAAVRPRELFKSGLRRSTILLWAASFLSLALIYSTGSWLPTVLLENGYALSSALSFTMAFSLGAAAGSLLLALLADRGHLRAVTVGGFALAAVLLAGLPFAQDQPTLVVLLLCALAGVGSLATQALVVTNMVNTYPLALRGTGLGFGSGFGRLGAIVGPGYLAAMTTLLATPRAGFYAFALLALLGGLAIAALPRRRTAVATPPADVAVPAT